MTYVTCRLTAKNQDQLWNPMLGNHILATFTFLPRWAGARRNIHPLTSIVIIRHPLSTSSLYYSLQHRHCSIYVLESSFLQSLFRSSFGLLLGLEPSTIYSLHFFTQSSSSFHSTCPYHRSLFFCNTSAMSSIPNLSFGF